MLKQTEDETIANLNKFLSELRRYDETLLVFRYQFCSNDKNKIGDVDSWLDLKWNFLKYVVEQNQLDSNDKLCKTFFDNENNKSKMYKIRIKDKPLGMPAILSYFFNFLLVSNENNKINKIDVTAIHNELTGNEKVENKNVKLEADNAFIKFCKGMYRLGQSDFNTEDMKQIFINGFFYQPINSFFKQNQRDQVIYVFNNIDKIECEDDEFKEVKKILSELQLIEDQDNSELLKFVERKGIDKEKNSIVIERNRGKHTEKTDQTTNPFIAPAIIGIFLPIVPSIVFIINIAYNDKYKFGPKDIPLIIVGLIPVVSAIVFGILAYNYDPIIDDNKSISSGFGAGGGNSVDDKLTDKNKNQEQERKKNSAIEKDDINDNLNYSP